MISFAGFLNAYFRENANTYATFEANLEEPIKYLKTLDEKNEKIYITNTIKEPYIYVLFYSEYNTNDFVSTVEYYNPGEAFRQVKKFGNYNFEEINELENENVYLVKNDQYESIKTNPQRYGIQNLEDEFDIKEFAEYTVLQGKEDYE